MDITELQKTTSEYIMKLESALDGVGFSVDMETGNPDERMPFVVCNLIRLFHERLRDIETALDITGNR